jgi:transposase
MSKHVEGVSRDQVSLLPDRLDDFVALDHVVRVIDAYVDRLDMAELGFRHAVPAAQGRPPYSPCDVLKLYLYGYMHGIQSSRRLETESRRNVELMWLLRKLVPDHKTIASFRQHERAAIVAVCAAFVRFCRDRGQLAKPQVAVDGTKIRAAAGRRAVLSRKKVEQELSETREKITKYLTELDEADRAENAKPGQAETAAWARKALERLRKRQGELEEQKQAVEQSGRDSLVPGEPEARPMHCNGAMVGPAYNAQFAVSTDTHLIVHHALTQDVNDRQQLYPMASGAQQALGIAPPSACEGEARPRPQLQAVADSGYSNGEHAAQCEAAGIEPCVPPQRGVNQKGFFDASKFTYDAASNSYICPAGERLPFKQRAVADKLDRYMAKDCRQCPMKAQCTDADRRTVSRSWFEPELERMAQRVAADRSLMQQRRATAEHPFGTLKRRFGGKFLTRGLAAARAELALQVLAHNFGRMLRLCGARPLLAALA